MGGCVKPDSQLADSPRDKRVRDGHDKQTERILQQGQALARDIESLETIEPTGPIERVRAWFLLQAYRHRLRAIVAVAPEWLAEGILSASERIGDDTLACG